MAILETEITMKRTLLFVLISALCLPLFAGNDVVRVAATYEYVSDNSRETPEQAERTAIERAKQKALEEKFGVDVTAVTNTLITNRSGSDAQSQTNVFSLGGTAVRGEWIETTKKEVLEMAFVQGFWKIRVHIEGKARNTTSEKADIHYAFIKDVQDLESPVTFRDGSDLFLRFSSPVTGYLCVYLIDETKNAYCLLPYMSQQTGSQPVEANRDYIFFSSNFTFLIQFFLLFLIMALRLSCKPFINLSKASFSDSSFFFKSAFKSSKLKKSSVKLKIIPMFLKKGAKSLRNLFMGSY